jgi:hypothetical protein
MEEAMANGTIVYRGPSMLDRSKNVVAILTGLKRPSANSGTGPMLQLWILDDVESPLGDRSAICGDCPLQDGRCYINWGQGPASVWKGYKRGIYPEAKCDSLVKLTEGRKVRFGAAGEPAALPVSVIFSLAESAKMHTGYTHQWRRFPKMKRFLMASVDSVEEMKEAQEQGWRTFRTTMKDEGAALPSWGVMENEITCPKAVGMQCADCGACDGAFIGDKRASIVMPVHGSTAVMSKWRA